MIDRERPAAERGQTPLFNSSLETAANWIVEHENDAEKDQMPFGMKVVLYYASRVRLGESLKNLRDLNALSTPESFVTHSNFDTPGGTVYYIPKVSADVLLVKGTVYDSVEDCVVAYMKYAAEAGFVVRRSCQKRMLNGDVKQKYLVCNRMDTVTRKFVLHVFDTIHNHELEREEYKHLSKTERQLTYMEQAFIVKAASVNIGATRAHHLLTGIKGSYLLVHGTTVDFKNFFRSVNCYIGDSDAQMLIHKMENRKKHVSDFLFDYLVENAELTAIFWADEVSKYNYREFGDVVSFDATFKTNKYKMVFVPFTAIDNHRKCVTVAAGLLKNETTKSYIWLLKAFIKAFGKAPSIVVTDQDGAMRNAIEAEFGGSKHRLCMWHITQKLPAKNANVELIQQQYILRRWTKNLIPAALRNKRNRYGEKNVVVENYANEATSIVDHCVHLLSKDEPRLGTFVEKLKSLKKEVEADCLNPPSKNKTNNLEQLVGVPNPSVVNVNNPTVGLTKGRKKLRIKGGKEKAIEKSLKGRNSMFIVCWYGTIIQGGHAPREFHGQDEVWFKRSGSIKRKFGSKRKCRQEEC
ncbi:protein FAR1-related sequence 5 [Tanacetum coccineum]